ncbi:MAG TPA: nuclear transport factor 2 family protein [Chitinophagaceae bacterium]|nr:nuclear transport factor 2 family protein [Chitinophagaceae bacterium]
MTNNNRILRILLIVLIFTSGCSGSHNVAETVSPKQVSLSAELYDTIAHMDSVLFNAFNSKDVEILKTLFTSDLEFYHDTGGLTDYTQNMLAFENTAAQNPDLKRELIPGSMEVYPVKDFGAMQIGSHRFCHTENGKPDCGVFKFVHIWKKTNKGWKICRVVSYGH